MNEFDDLPRSEFAFPGPLRDRLVSAILDGRKTSTTSTAVEYRIENEPLPQIGARQVVVDSAEKTVAVIETTGVHQVGLAVVPWEHARDEGEGYSSVARNLQGLVPNLRPYIGNLTLLDNPENPRAGNQ